MTLAGVLSSTADLGGGYFDKVHLLPCLYLPWESSIWGIGVALKMGRDLCLIISEDADKSLKDTEEQ